MFHVVFINLNWLINLYRVEFGREVCLISRTNRLTAKVKLCVRYNSAFCFYVSEKEQYGGRSSCKPVCTMDFTNDLHCHHTHKLRLTKYMQDTATCSKFGLNATSVVSYTIYTANTKKCHFEV